MFIRASTIIFSITALAGIATATAVLGGLEARWSNTCSSGNVQCCNSVQESSSSFVGTLFDFLGLSLPSPGTQIGLTCSPITAGASGSGGTCTQQTVCCNGDTISGVIVTGCSPITINA